MQVYKSDTFDGFTDRDSAAVYSDIEFRNCEFQSCSISTTCSPPLRTTVRNVRLVNASEYGCAVDSAILEDVVVDGLNTHGDTLLTCGAVFKHVELKGKIDFLLLSNLVFPGHATPEEQQAFDEANAAYYAQVDWALDISRAEFKDIDIRGVPARLIRRDPETQVVITRENALTVSDKSLDFRGPATPVAINMFLDQGHPDFVLVVPKRDKRFNDYLADIQLLRKAGVAEPD